MLTDINFNIVYTTGENEPIQFFFDALTESVSFDLGLGYFNSSAIHALSYGFAYFIVQGGKMRVIINTELSSSDKKAIISGQKQTFNNIEEGLLSSLKLLSKELSRNDEHFLNCFSYLISQKRIEFLATTPVLPDGGIAHPKYGLFKDKGGNIVGFNGSANFSSNAFYNNFESISCYRSWLSDNSDNERILYFGRLFNSIWEGQNENLKSVPIEKVKCYIKENFHIGDIQELLADERALLNELRKRRRKSIYRYMLKKIEMIEDKPVFPLGREPRTYQRAAYSKWIENGSKGIFAMATGTGKTITSLNCILEEYKRTDYYNAIIVVPTQALAIQWEKDLQSFNFTNYISTFSEAHWESLINKYIIRTFSNIAESLILVTTYSTFNRKKFQSILHKIKNIKSFIYIADEVHNLGSSLSLKMIPYMIEKRIGLSATPERIYDEFGSKILYSFFSSEPPSYTYCYSMKEAIYGDNPVLCMYEYYPRFVALDESEMESYIELSKKLARYYNSDSGKYEGLAAEKLLLIRKQIIHKASSKKEVLKEILNQLADKLEYAFIYAPEGYEHDYSSSDYYSINNEDNHIINLYGDIIKDAGFTYYKYVGGIPNPSKILQDFANGKIKVLLSMKCLDEGVDIPRTEYAIFCSSTGNPRQFIQRRGRVLRKILDKKDKRAKIYDLVVLPPNINWDKELSNIEKNIFRSELRRVINFLALADNRLEILNGKLKDICHMFDIDPYEMLLIENEKN
jgi:superfamily II DNA or RNA helicase